MSQSPLNPKFIEWIVDKYDGLTGEKRRALLSALRRPGDFLIVIRGSLSSWALGFLRDTGEQVREIDHDVDAPIVLRALSNRFAHELGEDSIGFLGATQQMA